MRLLLSTVLLIFAVPIFSAAQQIHVGEIEFFGYGGLDYKHIRTALLVKEGADLNPIAIEPMLLTIKRAVRSEIGREATDVNFTCCDDHGNWIVFIGLPGSTFHNFRYNALPRGTARLPSGIVGLYEKAGNLVLEAAQREPHEDDSKGYALSYYAPYHALQLAMRKYALTHAPLLVITLKTAGDPKQRRAAPQSLVTRGKPECKWWLWRMQVVMQTLAFVTMRPELWRS